MDRIEFSLARTLARKNPTLYRKLLFYSRLTGLIWSGLITWVLYNWAKELFSPWSGTTVAALWLLDPTAIAFTSVVVPDVPATALGLLANYRFWHYLQKPSFQTASVAGVCLGGCFLTKSTWLILPLLWLLLTLFWRFSTSQRYRVWHGLWILFLSWFCLNSGYGWSGFLKPLGEFSFISEMFTGIPAMPQEDGSKRFTEGNRFKNTWLEKFPCPLPFEYVSGIDQQKRDFEGRFWSYLNGEWRREGWWVYYIWGLFLKLPLPTLILIVLGLINFRSLARRDWLVVVTPFLGVLLFVSSQRGFNHHLRYTLPAWPYLFLLVGSPMACSGFFNRQANRISLLKLILIIWLFSCSLRISPHFMSYFNEIGYGPTHGWHYFVDSNIDWGQDTFFLKEWLDNHPEVREIHLALHTNLDPKWFGIAYLPIPQEITPGWYAISCNYLAGSKWDTGIFQSLRPRQYSWFQHFQSVDRIGYSIYLYHLTEADIQELKR